MSSLIDLHLDDVEDPIVLPGGEEYQLKIVSAKIEKSKSSERNVIKVMYEVVDNPTAKTVFDNYAFPLKDDPEKTVYMMKNNMKQFFLAFGIDLADPGKPEEWVGNEAWCVLKESLNQQGAAQNEVSRWIASK